MNPSDYIADTPFLSLEGHGVYSLILHNLWIHDGELPADFDKLSRLLRGDVRRIRRIITTELAGKLDIKDGVMKHKRVTHEIAKAIEKSEKAQASAHARHYPSNGANAPPNADNETSEHDANQEPRTKSKKKKRQNKYSDDDFVIAGDMFSLIQTLNPEHKKPNLEKWAEAIRLIREVDKKNHVQIYKLFEFANKHDFWKTNILSPASLRKQWDRLIIERDNGHSNGQRFSKKTTGADIIANQASKF